MKEDRKAYRKAYYEAHREEHIAYMKAYAKAYYEAHKEQRKARMKEWQASHKEQVKAYQKVYKKAYIKSDVNSKGQTKHSIRKKSQRILKKSGIKIPGYQIHHCFGYEDPSKFIYCSKSLHLKIHQFLRDNEIDVDKDHWMAIRDLVNSTNEFWYIKD